MRGFKKERTVHSGASVLLWWWGWWCCCGGGDGAGVVEEEEINKTVGMVSFCFFFHKYRSAVQ